MQTIKDIIDFIVPEAVRLNGKYFDEKAPINYAAVFSQSDAEFEELAREAGHVGEVVDDTPTGPLFKLREAMPTTAGPLRLIKIRKPDPSRPERGDADFTLADYAGFKEKHLPNDDHFKLIIRPGFEMIELHDPDFTALSYFSHPPLTDKFGIS